MRTHSLHIPSYLFSQSSPSICLGCPIRIRPLGGTCPLCVGWESGLAPCPRSGKGQLLEPFSDLFFITPSFFLLILRGMGDPPWKSGPHPLLTRVFTHWRGGICTSVVQCCLVRPNNNRYRYRRSFESTHRLLPSSGLNPGSGKKTFRIRIIPGSRIHNRIYPALIRIL